MYIFVCIYLLICLISPKAIEGKPSLYDCSPQCTDFACVANITLCQLNPYLSSCGCCHLCLKNNREYCGGPYGTYGVCKRGLGCTVSEQKFLSTEDSRVGICLPIACIRSCRGKRTSPVCGSNGYVFKNICELKKYACVRSVHISSVPLTQCVNNRHCKQLGRACNFVTLQSRKGNFKNIWSQAYKCSGMSSCMKHYSRTPWCASNEKSYSSKCQMNMHACILNSELRADYMGRCSDSYPGPANNLLVRLHTYTQTIIPTSVPTAGGGANTYNSSDPYST